MKSILIVMLLMSNYISSQNRVPPPPCLANGNSGFGGAVGEGQFIFWGENNLIEFTVNTGANVIDGVYTYNEMNDILVLYIDTGAPGRNEIDTTVDDSADDHRVAITNSNLYGKGSLITFPQGFETSYAIAIDELFGGLWSIPSAGDVGPGELDFITSVNSTLTPSSDGIYSFTFNWEDIGLSLTDEFHFVGLYVSKTACNSNEGYGEGIAIDTDCKDDIIFTGYLTLPGCTETLSVINNVTNNIQVYYFNDQLLIKGLNEVATISIYDILGREIYSNQHQIQESVPIPFELNKNELQFIVIESANKKKVLKVIPN